MKRALFGFAAAAAVSFGGPVNAGLIITGLGDPDGGTGDILELYATSEVADLSIYSIEVASNSSSLDGVGTTSLASGSLAAGDFYYITTDSGNFSSFFGFAADEDLNISINGNDTIGLYESGTLIDRVLDDGDTTDIHGDGYIYRKDGFGPNTSFVAAEWDAFTDVLASSSSSTNAASTMPLPVGSYVPEPASLALVGLGGLAMLGRGRRA